MAKQILNGQKVAGEYAKVEETFECEPKKLISAQDLIYSNKYYVDYLTVETDKRLITDITCEKAYVPSSYRSVCYWVDLNVEVENIRQYNYENAEDDVHSIIIIPLPAPVPYDGLSPNSQSSDYETVSIIKDRSFSGDYRYVTNSQGQLKATVTISPYFELLSHESYETDSSSYLLAISWSMSKNQVHVDLPSAAQLIFGDSYVPLSSECTAIVGTTGIQPDFYDDPEIRKAWYTDNISNYNLWAKDKKLKLNYIETTDGWGNKSYSLNSSEIVNVFVSKICYDCLGNAPVTYKILDWSTTITDSSSTNQFKVISYELTDFAKLYSPYLPYPYFVRNIDKLNINNTNCSGANVNSIIYIDTTARILNEQTGDIVTVTGLQDLFVNKNDTSTKNHYTDASPNLFGYEIYASDSTGVSFDPNDLSTLPKSKSGLHIHTYIKSIVISDCGNTNTSSITKTDLSDWSMGSSGNGDQRYILELIWYKNKAFTEKFVAFTPSNKIIDNQKIQLQHGCIITTSNSNLRVAANNLYLASELVTMQSCEVYGNVSTSLSGYSLNLTNGSIKLNLSIYILIPPINILSTAETTFRIKLKLLIHSGCNLIELNCPDYFSTTGIKSQKDITLSHYYDVTNELTLNDGRNFAEEYSIPKNLKFIVYAPKIDNNN